MLCIFFSFSMIYSLFLIITCKNMSDTKQRVGKRKEIILHIIVPNSFVVVSFRSPRDHATCPFCTKQTSDMRPLLEPPSGSPRSIQISSSPDG